MSEIIDVIVVKRRDDYKASVKDYPAIGGCGANIKEAVGDLIITHADIFHINISKED